MKKIIIGFIILLIGFGLGSHGKTTKAESREVAKEVVKEVVKEVPADGQWKQLKVIDDKFFTVSGEALGLCGQGYTAISNGDITRLSEINNEVPKKTAEIKGLTSERNAVLQKLGY